MSLMSKPLHTSSALLLFLLCAGSPRASAAGFQLREQSPSAQGNSYAGISAGGSDISSMFFNVATLTRFQGNELVGGAILIQPSARLDNGSASRAAAFGKTPITGTPSGDAGESAAVPLCYGLWSLSPDLKLGFSLNSPFGLSSGYPGSWIGRYHAMKSEIQVLEVAPNLAYRINGKWSVGVAVTGRHVDAKLTNAVDFGAIGAAYHVPGSIPGGQDGVAKVTGQRWGVGYKLGVLFEPRQDLRFGAAYHSAIDFHLRGKIHYEGVPAALTSKFMEGSAIPMANQPATAMAGAAWDVSPTLTLQAEAARTFWTRFQDIRITFDTGQADSVTLEKWKDTWFLSLGLTWQPKAAWTLRTGLALDQTPTTDTFRTPRIPDAERIWASVGAGYAFTKHFSMDLGYSHLFVKNANLDLRATAGSPDFLRGNLSGTYHNKVDILALQGRITF